MTELSDRIASLDRTSAYEAAQFVAVELGAQPDGDVPASPLVDDPLAHQDDVEDLAKVVLLTAAEVDPAMVERALDGVGQRQIVFGGLELVALAILAVGALHIIVTKGKSGESTSTRVEKDANGKEVVTTRTETRYAISDTLGGMLRSIFPGP